MQPDTIFTDKVQHHAYLYSHCRYFEQKHASFLCKFPSLLFATKVSAIRTITNCGKQIFSFKNDMCIHVFDIAAPVIHQIIKRIIRVPIQVDALQSQ